MRTTIILIALVLAVPAAAANWTYRGNNEPDNAFDDASFMFFEPDTSTSGHKVYFNGFNRVARETHYNPNVGVLGTRIQPVTTTMSAMLGFWKDCNKDGYVGLAETAALEYRAELLLAATVCPPTTPVPGQTIYPHNDGTWIREIIWIGPGTVGAIGAPSQNPTNFYADGTGVWADWGLPGGRPTLICPTSNVGIRSTGAMVEFADCYTYFRGVRALNAAQDQTGLPVGGWETHDIDNSPSTLNVDNPVFPYLYGPAEPEGHPQEGDYRGTTGGIFGRDTDENNRRQRLVTLVDCESDGLNTSPQVHTPGDLTDPATYPSAYESLNDTYEVALQNGNDPCSPSSASDEGLPYNAVHPTEGYTEPTFADQGRVEVDWPFEFSVGSRNLVPGHTCTRTNMVRGPLGYCPPADLGLAAERDDFAIGPAWRANAQSLTYMTTTREQLRTDQPDFGAFYFTFYARVGQRALDIGKAPATTPSTYGTEACGAAESGIVNGWNCDPEAWVDRCEDPSLPTLPAQCYRKGFQYHARDVDCWDGTLVRGVGVHASLTDISPSGPCVDHPSNAQPDLSFT